MLLHGLHLGYLSGFLETLKLFIWIYVSVEGRFCCYLNVKGVNIYI